MASPRTPGSFLLFVIALLIILIVLPSGVLGAPDDLAHVSKDVAGANETQTTKMGRSNVTIKSDCGPGHGAGNGYGGGNGYGPGYGAGGNGYGAGYGGGNGYNTPMPQGHNPMTYKGAADHARGVFAAGYCVLLLGAIVSWMLL